MESGPDQDGQSRFVPNEVDDTLLDDMSPQLRLVSTDSLEDTPPLRAVPGGLHDETRQRAIDSLNQLLIDLIALQSFHSEVYKDSDLIEALDRRIRTLGGHPLRAADQIDDMTLLHPDQDGPHHARLIRAHSIILSEARTVAEQALRDEDFATLHLVSAQIIGPFEDRAAALSHQGGNSVDN